MSIFSNIFAYRATPKNKSPMVPYTVVQIELHFVMFCSSIIITMQNCRLHVCFTNKKLFVFAARFCASFWIWVSSVKLAKLSLSIFLAFFIFYLWFFVLYLNFSAFKFPAWNLWLSHSHIGFPRPKDLEKFPHQPFQINEIQGRKGLFADSAQTDSVLLSTVCVFTDVAYHIFQIFLYI